VYRIRDTACPYRIRDATGFARIAFAMRIAARIAFAILCARSDVFRKPEAFGMHPHSRS
jgi:hypothetical protein